MDEREIIKQKLSNYQVLYLMRKRGELKHGDHYTHDAIGNRLYNEAGLDVIVKHPHKRGRPKKSN